MNDKYLFQVFSIYVIDTTDDYISINYDDELLNTVINRSIYKFDVLVSTTDKILTLSTCYNNDKKTLMYAKKILNK